EHDVDRGVPVAVEHGTTITMHNTVSNGHLCVDLPTAVARLARVLFADLYYLFTCKDRLVGQKSGKPRKVSGSLRRPVHLPRCRLGLRHLLHREIPDDDRAGFGVLDEFFTLFVLEVVELV